MSFHDPELLDPIVHCFARCNWCKRLIAIATDEEGELILEERKCPHCGVFLDDDQITNSFVVNLIHTQAIASANKLSGLDPGVVVFVGLCILLAAVDYPMTIRILNNIMYLGWIPLIANWFHKYWYQFRFDDEEYLEALRGMKRSLALWTSAQVLSWALLLV